MRTRSLFRAIVIAGAALTGAVACSGDDDGGTDAGDFVDTGTPAIDAGRDAMAALDAGMMMDAGRDAGPPIDDAGPFDAGEDGMVLIL